MTFPNLAPVVTVKALNDALGKVLNNAPDGALNSPGISFSQDPTTGITRQQDGSMALVQGGKIALVVQDGTAVFDVTPSNGTTARELQEVMGDWLTLKSFGAKGDGATNDMSSLLSAIASGQMVVATEGEYIGTFDGALKGQACWHPASVGCVKFNSELIPIGNIYFSVTLYVGSGHAFSSLLDCLNYLLDRKIYAPVTIQIADGTYAVAQHHFSHPDGGQVSIIGNTGSPGNVVFNVDTSSRNSFLLVDQSCVIGLVDGLTINGTGWVSHGVWTANNVGCAIQSDAGASVYLGSNIVINKFYYGLRANTGAYIGASSGLKITEAGDVGVHAFNGGHIECPGIDVSLCADTGNSLGNGIMAESGGTISCEGVFSHSNAQNGVMASSNGVVWALNCNASANGKHQVSARLGGTVMISSSSGGKAYATSGTDASSAAVRAETGGHVEADGDVFIYSNAGDGISANGGTIECSGASVQGNGGIGVVARNCGTVFYGTVTNSGNTGGGYL